jgi:transcriptional regulator with XRE-family HTH domain
MGRSSRTKPARLAEKLLQIRMALGLSQNGMLKQLGFDEDLFQGSISGYELGTREPPLPVLLRYAQTAGVWIDVLVDDEIDMPEKLPASPKSEGARRKKPSRGKKS